MNGVWEKALGALREKLSASTVANWAEPLALESLEGASATVRAPSRFHADWFRAHYATALTDALSVAADKPIATVTWIVVDTRTDADGAARDASTNEEHASAELDRPSSSWPSSSRPASSRPASSRPASSRPSPSQHRGEMATPAAARRTALRAPQKPRVRDRFSGELPFADTAVGVDAPLETPDEREQREREYGLNPRYRFENFIVGASNQLAHAACIAASGSPSSRYNPLFIYSNVGLGKTHLVNAVGHRVIEARPNTRVMFLSAERFTNEFIWGLQHRRIDEFRARYRSNCDVLIIDDIQFLAGREQTQEEFFHTFNALYHADKQIVVTCDVFPQQIREMQDRLVSRFQWGLVADVQTPELDTRIAILRKKAEQDGIFLADPVALFVAQRIQTNVRELEGTLLRLAVRADLEKRPIDLELARAMLGTPAGPSKEKATNVEDIQRATCEYFGLKTGDLLGQGRHRGVSFPRMLAMWVARERLKLSYPDIGHRFGNRDHTTVMSAYRKVTGLLANGDAATERAMDAIERKLGLR